jgi:mono/diheme cytochrome c family protein
MQGLSVLVLVASISFIAGAGLTYVAKTPWTSDMANQASIKPQEGPMLPPQGSVATDMVGGPGASAGDLSGPQTAHQEMGHHHGASGAAGHQHDTAAAKHDHGSKEKAQGMGHQHGTSDAGGHQHGSTGAKHDHAAKSASPTKTTDTRPLPTDLMGSAGTGPGKTLQSPGGQAKGDDRGMGQHEHGSKAASQPAAKGSAGHSHGAGADHEHGTSKTPGHEHGKSAPHSHGTKPHSHGGEKAEKMKGGAHHHGAGAGHGHAHGEMQAQIVNPIKATEASVKKGHQLFNIYCSVCHGTEGRGGMPMQSKIPGIPKFTAKLLRSVDDNHMFSMVTSGHGPMPGYAEALTPEERWHVTNYVRMLQRKLADEQTASGRQGASR